MELCVMLVPEWIVCTTRTQCPPRNQRSVIERLHGVWCWSVAWATAQPWLLILFWNRSATRVHGALLLTDIDIHSFLSPLAIFNLGYVSRSCRDCNMRSFIPVLVYKRRASVWLSGRLKTRQWFVQWKSASLWSLLCTVLCGRLGLCRWQLSNECLAHACSYQFLSVRWWLLMWDTMWHFVTHLQFSNLVFRCLGLLSHFKELIVSAVRGGVVQKLLP